MSDATPFMDDVSEGRLAAVNQIFADRVRRLAAALGFAIRITFGMRNTDEQTALWSQGRVALAVVNALRKKVNLAPLTDAENVVVTKAPPYHSWHEYGMAVDVVPMIPTPDWNTSHPDWQKIIDLASQYGLKDGIGWKDEPHLQPAELPLSPTPQYVMMLQQGKTMQEIWDFAALPEAV